MGGMNGARPPAPQGGPHGQPLGSAYQGGLGPAIGAFVNRQMGGGQPQQGGLGPAIGASMNAQMGGNQQMGPHGAPLGAAYQGGLGPAIGAFINRQMGGGDPQQGGFGPAIGASMNAQMNRGQNGMQESQREHFRRILMMRGR